jgi:hypothetical protein
VRIPTKPWYRASKDAWYVEFNGRQVRLAKGRDNEKAAREAFYKLMANGSGKLPDADTLRVATICDLFLDHSQKHHVPDTYHWYQDYLQDFCDLYGTLLVLDLKPLHVSKWLDGHPGWKGARRCAVIAIKRAFNWAEGEGLLAVNPLRKVKKPPQTFRERVFSREERHEVMACPSRKCCSGGRNGSRDGERGRTVRLEQGLRRSRKSVSVMTVGDGRGESSGGMEQVGGENSVDAYYAARRYRW